MKSSFRILAACLAASLALVSCEKESTTKSDNGGETKDGVRTITMSFSPSTRSALADDGVTPHFTDGDQIMLADEAKQTETVTVTVSGNTATASTNLKGKLTAVYPASASTDGKNYTVSSSQDGTFAKANICTATIPDGKNPEAEFETQVAIFKFFVPEKEDDKGISYSPKTIKVRGSENIADGSKEITITGKDSDAIATSDGGFYYLAVLPGKTISNLTICSGDGMRCPTASGTLAANTIYDVALPVLNGHEYVELTMTVGDKTKTYKWATMNVGASSPTEYDDYFMWGDTTGYSAATTGENAFQFGTGSKGFAWENYLYTSSVYSESNKKVFTKYVPSAKGADYWNGTGNVDDKNTLESSDDAATVNWGSGWRMPTEAEFDALKSLSSKVWTTDYNGTGVNGCVFSDGTNRVFVPAAGCGNGTKLSLAGSYGYYWSSSLTPGNPDGAYILFFKSNGVGTASSSRCNGYSVRPLSE